MKIELHEISVRDVAENYVDNNEGGYHDWMACSYRVVAICPVNDNRGLNHLSRYGYAFSPLISSPNVFYEKIVGKA